MNKKIVTVLLAMLLTVTPAFALYAPESVVSPNWNALVSKIKLPLSFLMTSVNPNTVYSKSFNMPTTGITFDTCTNSQYYNTGACTWFYKCYVVLPKGCQDPSCSTDKWCSEPLTALANPEPVTVTFTAGTAGTEYGVVTFIATAHMVYNWDTSQWSTITGIIDSTRMTDTVKVNVPVPPLPPNTITWLVNLFQAIWNAIFCKLNGTC
jgi:hypothetical protein